MSGKRTAVELDPDYEDVTYRETKRQRLLEQDAKEATKRKIESIIRRQFAIEIQSKEMEVNVIDQRLAEARVMVDRLRACIVANYYGSAGQQRASQGKPTPQTLSIHPTVKKHIIGKAPVNTIWTDHSYNNESGPPCGGSGDHLVEDRRPGIKQEVVDEVQVGETIHAPGPSGDGGASGQAADTQTDRGDQGGRGSRFKIKRRIIVGNVSKYITMDKRESNDPSTHKWMVYVRGSKDESRIEHFVSKVWFFLHPSYRPNDLVEISTPPFHLTRRGWGEFPVRIQLHFKDGRNKRVDLIHQLKLDRTYTGLQTLGAETHVDVEIEREQDKIVGEKAKTQQAIGDPRSIPSGTNTAEQSQNVRLTFKDCLSEDKNNQQKKVNQFDLEVGDLKSKRKISESDFKESLNKSRTIDSGTPVVPEHPAKKANLENGGILNSSSSSILDNIPPATNRIPKSLIDETQYEDSFLMNKLAMGSHNSLNSNVDLNPGKSENISRTNVITGDADTGMTLKRGVITENSVQALQCRTENLVKPLTTLDSLIDTVLGTPALTSAQPGAQQRAPISTPVKSEVPMMSSVSSTGVINITIPAMSTSKVTAMTKTSPLQIPTGAKAMPISSLSALGPAVILPAVSRTTCTPVVRTVPSGLPSTATAVGLPTTLSRLPTSTATTAISLPITLTKDVTTSGLPLTTLTTSGIQKTSGISATTSALQTIPAAKLVQSTSASETGGGTSMSANPGLVYVRCVDNQGKIYLIPQHLLPQLSVAQRTQLSVGQKLSPPNKNHSLPKAVSTVGFTSPSKVTILGSSSSSPSAVSHRRTMTGSTLQLSSGALSDSLIQSNIQSPFRFSKGASNNLTTTATVSVTKAAGESGLLTLNTVTSPSKTAGLSNTGNHGNTKDIKVSSIASCPRAKQPMILLTQNTQKAVSLLQPAAQKGGKNMAVIGGIGGISLVQSAAANASMQSVKPNATLSFSGFKPSVLTTSQNSMTGKAANLKGLLTGSQTAITSQKLTLQSPVLKTGTTVLLNKGLPLNQFPPKAGGDVSGTPPPLKSPQQLTQVTPKTSPNKLQQTVVATIGNQHYLLQLIPDQQSSTSKNQKILLPSHLTNQQQVTLSKQSTCAGIAQSTGSSTMTNLLSNPTMSQPGVSLQFSTSSALFANLTTTLTPSAPVPGQTLRPSSDWGHSVQGTNFKPVQLTTRFMYSRKRDGDVSLLSQFRPGEHKSRIILGKRNKNELIVNNSVPNIRVEDLPDMYSLVKSVAKLYPIISPTADRNDHPYCAKSTEDWVQWNVGKRRASEWQRASCVGQHIRKLIGKNCTFRGEELWKTKRIVHWCRLHAFSPYYLEKTSGTELSSDQEQQREDEGRELSSYTGSSDVLTRLEDLSQSTTTESDEEEIDIISIVPPTIRIKKEIKKEEVQTSALVLPPSGQAVFVQDISQKIGVRYQPMELEPGVSGLVTADMVFTAMEGFMEDILRRTFAAGSTNKSNPVELKTSDLFKAMCEHKCMDFLTNRHVGVCEEKLSTVADR